MVSTIKNPWEYTWISLGILWIFHGQYHGVSVEFWNMAMLLLYLLWIIHGNPWVFHVFPMVNTWDFLWGFKYGHRKDMGIP